MSSCTLGTRGDAPHAVEVDQLEAQDARQFFNPKSYSRDLVMVSNNYVLSWIDSLTSNFVDDQ